MLVVDPPTFSSASSQFAAYDDQEISFVDHTSVVLTDDRDIDHIFAFDSDLRTLGLTRVPIDTGEIG